VFDRGYQDDALYRKILDARSSFTGRVKDNIAYNRQQEQELTEEARKAGVIRDMLVTRIGTDRLSVLVIGAWVRKLFFGGGLRGHHPHPPAPLSRQLARGRSALAHAARFNCFAPLALDDSPLTIDYSFVVSLMHRVALLSRRYGLDQPVRQNSDPSLGGD